MRVVTWNMQAAFGSGPGRHERAWHYLRALDPDIALLQEANPPKWAHEEWRVFHELAYTGQTWGSAVLVKDGLHSWALEIPEENPTRRYEGSPIVLVEISAYLQSLIVGSIHASTSELNEEQVLLLENQGVDLAALRCGGVKGIWPLYVIFADLGRLLPEKSFIVGGDFNAARLMDQSSWMAGGNSEFFDKIESSGFRSALAKFHDGEVQTYFKKNSRPYQLDHLYCDEESLGRLARCMVIEHPVKALDLSDHAPIVADFAL
ncbi:MAG: endonuclease/exonuclease/phosphatase family protein [Gammaproteobacteria bacterium]